jgi:dipeptidyl-peptidase-4
MPTPNTCRPVAAAKKRNFLSNDLPKKPLVLLIAYLLWMLVAESPLLAQQSFDMDQFFRRAFLQREFQPKSFGPARWLNQGEAYTTLEPSSSFSGFSELVRYDSATGKREVLIAASDLFPAGSKDPLHIEGYDWSGDMSRVLIYTNSRRVWRANTRGDYWVFERHSKSLRKLGGDATPSTMMFAKFSPDGSRVAYVRANNIYVESVQTAETIQLTRDGSETIINGISDWVYEEEFFLRDAFRWSPDGKRIAYWQFNTSGVQKFALLYNVGAPYDVVTHIPYPQYGVYPLVKEIPYPEPGTPNSSVRAGTISSNGGETTWLQIPGDPTNSYIARMEWAGSSNTLVLQHLNRMQNTNDVLLADANTGAVQQVYRDHDSAWVDVVDHLQWLHGGKDFLWLSERDGWRQAYAISRDGKQVRRISPADCDVIEVVGVTPGEDWLYYLASPENATQRYLYRTGLDGRGKAERLTPANQPGMHSYQISPDFRWAIHSYSRFDSPPVTDLVHVPDYQSNRVLEDNTALRASLKAYLSRPTEFIHVDVGDGVTLDAWMMKPKDFDPAKKYPVLVYVYGEPAGQTVVDAWEGESGIFHRALTESGYLVVSVDNRGTPAPKGRAWRKVVYGSVGVLSSTEQTKALQILERTYPFMDANRVAVWGWSGGGSNTLNLMFRSPATYKVGMSVAPVADQRLYDSIYQERYMGIPQENSDGYRVGSPINFADGLKGRLLIVHSPGDDNVHYQGTELLLNRLVELGKPFDFMEYPGRTHSLAEGKETHYHVYSLLARYLMEHMTPGPLAN